MARMANTQSYTTITPELGEFGIHGSPHIDATMTTDSEPMGHSEPTAPNGNNRAAVSEEPDDDHEEVVKYKRKMRTVAMGMIIALLIIVVVLFVVHYQKRKAAISAEDPAVPMPKPGIRPLGGAPIGANQVPPQAAANVNMGRNPKVSDKMLASLTQKRVKRARPKAPPSGRQQFDPKREAAEDQQMLSTIMEEQETKTDPEEGKMKDIINQILHDEAKAEARVRDAKEEAAGMDEEGAPIGANEAAPGPVPPLEQVMCESIIKSGARQGQMCGRRCKEGADKCPMHNK